MSDRVRWRTRVDFDEIVAYNDWDLAVSVDDLNDRTAHYYDEH